MSWSMQVHIVRIPDYAYAEMLGDDASNPLNILIEQEEHDNYEASGYGECSLEFMA